MLCWNAGSSLVQTHSDDIKSKWSSSHKSEFMLFTQWAVKMRYPLEPQWFHWYNWFIPSNVGLARFLSAVFSCWTGVDSTCLESSTLTSCSVLMTQLTDGAECVGHDTSCCSRRLYICGVCSHPKRKTSPQSDA